MSDKPSTAKVEEIRWLARQLGNDLADAKRAAEDLKIKNRDLRKRADESRLYEQLIRVFSEGGDIKAFEGKLPLSTGRLRANVRRVNDTRRGQAVDYGVTLQKLIEAYCRGDSLEPFRKECRHHVEKLEYKRGVRFRHPKGHPVDAVQMSKARKKDAASWPEWLRPKLGEIGDQMFVLTQEWNPRLVNDGDWVVDLGGEGLGVYTDLWFTMMFRSERGK